MYARALDLELIGKPEEARRLFQLAAEQEPELFWLRYEIALCTRDLREWDAATEQFEALYEEARAGNDPRAAIVTLNSHGVMELQRNRYDAAEERFLAADATANEFGLPTDRATVKVNLALIANRRGRIDEAGLHYEGALDAWEEAEVEPPPIFLNNYAGHLLRQGRLTEARGFSERAVAGFRVQGHRRYEAPSLNRLGRILRRLGDLDGSLERHRESLAIYRDLDNVRGELSATGGIVTTYRARGDLTRARMHAEDALHLGAGADELGEGAGLVEHLRQTPDLGLEARRLDHAVDPRDRRVDVQRLLDVVLRARAQRGDGRVDRREGGHDDDRRLGMMLVHPLAQLDARRALHVHIREHEVVGLGPQQLLRLDDRLRARD